MTISGWPLEGADQRPFFLFFCTEDMRMVVPSLVLLHVKQQVSAKLQKHAGFHIHPQIISFQQMLFKYFSDQTQ